MFDQGNSVDDDNNSVDDESMVDCVKETGKVTGNAVAKWKFGNSKLGVMETHFKPKIVCGYNLISMILKSEKREISTEIVDYLKGVLCKGYSKYYEVHGMNIIKILKEQGKIELMRRILKNRQGLCDVIMSIDYYLTDLDIWLLCEELNLPVIIFSAKTIKGMMNGINWLYLSSIDDDFDNKLHFIRTSTINKSNESASYSLITPAMKCDDLQGVMRDVLMSSTKTDDNRMNFIDRISKVIIKKTIET